MARVRSEHEFEHWLHVATERADPFMAWLGIVFGLLVGYELAVELTPAATRSLAIAGWAIWGVFVAEFLAKLWIAPRRLRFLRRHWIQAAGLLIPTLRVLRFVRLLRLGRALPAARVLSSSYRGVGAARRLLGSRLAYLGATAAVVAIALAELAYLFERDHPDAVFEDFGDALLWSYKLVVSLQTTPEPASTGGNVVMLVGLAFGLVVVASLAGTFGAYLLEGRREVETGRAESAVAAPGEAAEVEAAVPERSPVTR